MDSPTRLFLIGYRGSGKTTVARIAAERLGWDAVDADDEIERLAGKAIAQIFADDGEQAFRDHEEEVVAGLCQRTECVVALGGGAVLRVATRERVAAAGLVVWLSASPEALAERIADDASSRTRRPNLTAQGGLLEIREVLAQRTPIYKQCADVTIDAESRSPEEIAAELVEIVRSKSLPSEDAAQPG